jgi:hypothetical protein
MRRGSDGTLLDLQKQTVQSFFEGSAPGMPWVLGGRGWRLEGKSGCRCLQRLTARPWHIACWHISTSRPCGMYTQHAHSTPQQI